MKIEDLKKLAESMDYKTRVWPWGKQLAYIDARQAQDRLDTVCGIENWKVEYKEHRWELFAWVSIKVQVCTKPSYWNIELPNQITWNEGVYEWITKWDWWSETKIEWEKWVISDSFKRACVVWGLWRFLYSIKPSWNAQNNAPAKDLYVLTTKDIEIWEWKIYWKSIYLNWEKKTISDEQITKLKAHAKYTELPPKK
jgi:hypothetical protein